MVSVSEDLGEDVVAKNPDLAVAQFRFLVGHPELDPKKKRENQKLLMDAIKEHKMAAYYKDLCSEVGIPLDTKLHEEMEAENQKKLDEIDSQIKDAEENLGESEVREGLMKKAEFLCSTGALEPTLAAFRAAYDKTVGIGNRIDITLHLIRVGLFHTDHQLVNTNLAKAKELMEQGGDWDRKNRLKAYEALYKMSVREFREAADLFLDAISTFTSYELMSYHQLVFYTVVCATFALERPELREKVTRGPEIQEQLYDQRQLRAYLQTLYDCDYAHFFRCLAWLEQELKFDRYFAPHYGYFVRGMRVKVYSQLLRSYRSLSLEYMSSVFGVSPDFVDKELHHMIASGSLHCRIDAVRGIVENQQLDSKNYQYQSVIKDGDILLNRIQKLSRVINA